MMTFETKVAVVLRDDLPTWQKLNVTAFTVSGVAGGVEGLMGENYEDGSGRVYLPMLRQPILIFEANAAQLRRAYERAIQREVAFSIFTDDLFSTGNDIDNRSAVKAKNSDELVLAGMALYGKKKAIDKALDGLSLHR